MKFGSVENPEDIDFTLPEDHPDTSALLSKYDDSGNSKPNVYLGCAKWNRQALNNFYPRGTKDELKYYATQFIAVELNATFYRNFPADQIVKWCGKVPGHFRFFQKYINSIVTDNGPIILKRQPRNT